MYTTTHDLSGKVIMITGASAGIGKATAIELAKQKATLYLVVRNLTKGQEVLREIEDMTGNKTMTLLRCDLCDLESIRECAREFLSRERRLDVLINNAGIAGQSNGHPSNLTSDGFELTMLANHFGPFLLTVLLLDCLKASAPSRIVNTSSATNAWAKFDIHNPPTFQRGTSYGLVNAYSCSKFANILFTRELARRLEGTGVTTNALHPGAVSTEIARDYPRVIQWAIRTVARPFMKTPLQGCQTTLYCALSPELDNVSGCYFADCKQKAPHSETLDDKLCAEFWEISEKLTGLKK